MSLAVLKVTRVHLAMALDHPAPPIRLTLLPVPFVHGALNIEFDPLAVF